MACEMCGNCSKGNGDLSPTPLIIESLGDINRVFVQGNQVLLVRPTRYPLTVRRAKHDGSLVPESEGDGTPRMFKNENEFKSFGLNISAKEPNSYWAFPQDAIRE